MAFVIPRNVIKVQGARGESASDTLRRLGLFGILPTDSDEAAMEKMAAYGVTEVLPGLVQPYLDEMQGSVDQAETYALLLTTGLEQYKADSLAAGQADPSIPVGATFLVIEDATGRIFWGLKGSTESTNVAEFATQSSISGLLPKSEIEDNGGAALVGTNDGWTVQEALDGQLPSANNFGTIQSAITSRNSAMLTNDAPYAESDITLGNSQTLVGNGGILNGTVGGEHSFYLLGYNPQVENVYLSDTSMLTGAAIKINEARFGFVDKIIAPNAKEGLLDIAPNDPENSSVTRFNITNCRAETVEGVGISIASSVNDVTFGNIEIFGKYSDGPDGYKPFPGSVGWLQDTPVQGGNAVGGHLVSNVTLINLQAGMKLVDAQLSKYSNIILDGTSDWGLDISGASEYIDFADLFVGTSRGIRIGGSSIVSITGLRTIFNGLVPPGGAPDFFDGAAVDLKIEGTATVRVAGWTGDKKVSVAPTARLIITDGQTLNGRTIASFGPGITGYLSEWGGSAGEEGNVWRINAPGRIIRMQPSPITAPGTGQSFTYTVRKNFADTTFKKTLSGSDVGGVDVWEENGGIYVTTGDTVSIKLVSSSGAATTYHQCPIQFIPN